jgi:hypothetical protein
MSFMEFLRKTFGPEGLFSSGQEGHAFLIGISEVICPRKPRWDMPPGYQANGNPLQEYHYYMFGRAVGILFWITTGCVIKLTLF